MPADNAAGIVDAEREHVDAARVELDRCAGVVREAEQPDAVVVGAGNPPGIVDRVDLREDAHCRGHVVAGHAGTVPDEAMRDRHPVVAVADDRAGVVDAVGIGVDGAGHVDHLVVELCGRVGLRVEGESGRDGGHEAERCQATDRVFEHGTPLGGSMNGEPAE